MVDFDGGGAPDTDYSSHKMACPPHPPQEERDMLEEDIREVNDGGIESLDVLDSREKTIAINILGDRWWA